MSRMISILPSLLAGDFGHLEDSALKAQAAGGDALHVDIMDGHFVPNLSMGPDVVKMAHRCLRIPLSVHLMVTRPDHYVEPFIEAGANTLLIHVESQCDVLKTLCRIRERGVRPGIALNPETPAQAVFPFYEAVEEVLCMTVHPGFGGQTFMTEVLPKITALRRHPFQLKKKGRGTPRAFDIAVDGGIDLDTVRLVAEAGANVIIAGSSLYKATDMQKELAKMRAIAEQAWQDAGSL